MAGRHEGTEDLFLIAFSQEIEVGLKLPDSQADSQPPFAGFRSRLATIQAGPASLLPSSTIDTSEREPDCGHLCTFCTTNVYFRAAYPAREPISPSLFLEYYPPSFFLSFFPLFFCPSITTPRFNLPKRRVGKKRKEIVKFLGNERQTFYFATIQQPPPPFSRRSHLTTIRSVLPARCQDLALFWPPKTNGKIQLGGRQREEETSGFTRPCVIKCRGGALAAGINFLFLIIAASLISTRWS